MIDGECEYAVDTLCSSAGQTNPTFCAAGQLGLRLKLGDGTHNVCLDSPARCHGAGHLMQNISHTVHVRALCV